MAKTAVLERDFKDWLGARISDLGISKSEAARRIGVDDSTVCLWVSGKRFPKRDRKLWETIASVMKVDVEEIPRW